MIDRVLTALTIAVLLLGAAACAAPEEEVAEAPAPPPQRVENPELGIALAAVPEGFRVVSNDGEGIVLERTVAETPGEMRVLVGPAQQAGVNLPKAVQEQKAALEAKPEGSFAGQGELMAPTGTAYSTRGRYQQDGATMEEIRLLSLHPTENRLLSVSYVYAVSGDAKERLEHAMTVLGEVEATTQPVPAEEGELPAADQQAPAAAPEPDPGE